MGFILILSLLGCSNGQGQKVGNAAYRVMLNSLLSHTVPEVSVKEMKDTLPGMKNKILFVDAREKREYNVSHIKDAVWVGYDNFDFSGLEKVDKNTSLVVYCSVGYRSEKIAEKLQERGFENVSNLYGGIFEWVNEDMPVYKNGNKTDSVHAYNKKWGIWLQKGEKVYGE